MRYLIDTNVVSEFRKGSKCNSHLAEWYSNLEGDAVFMSVLTVGELRKGIESIRRRDRKGADVLEAWLLELVSLHEDRILLVDREVAEEWGKMNVPDPLPVIDGLLAATAKVHGMTLATRNVKDVERTGISLTNPFV